MLRPRTNSAAHREALGRVTAWTRERFGLGDAAAISVSQVECRLPGCPPLETVVQFWTPDGTRHHFKVFKKTADIVEGDLPYAWMKQALAVPEGFECDCC
jgi:nitrate reductase delta subunit